MNDSLSVESLLKRDRVVVLAALAALCGLAWAYMIGEARAMIDTGVCACAGLKMSGPDVQAWSPAQLVPLFLMWAEMMVAMMVPSAAPMVLTFAAVNRKRREQARPYVPAGIFLGGYLAIWMGFSALAALAQADGGGSFSMDPLQARLPEPLPIAAGLSPDRLARGQGRRLPDGTQTRRPLRGLLLGPDGAAVRRRRDEHLVGGDPRHLRPGGKGRAERLVDRENCRRFTGRVGRLDAHRRSPLNDRQRGSHL